MMLTLRLGKFLYQIIEWLIGSISHKVLKETLKKLVNLILLEELLNRLLEVETLQLVHLILNNFYLLYLYFKCQVSIVALVY